MTPPLLIRSRGNNHVLRIGSVKPTDSRDPVALDCQIAPVTMDFRFHQQCGRCRSSNHIEVARSSHLCQRSSRNIGLQCVRALVSTVPPESPPSEDIATNKNRRDLATTAINPILFTTFPSFGMRVVRYVSSPPPVNAITRSRLTLHTIALVPRIRIAHRHQCGETRCRAAALVFVLRF